MEREREGNGISLDKLGGADCKDDAEDVGQVTGFLVRRIAVVLVSLSLSFSVT